MANTYYLHKDFYRSVQQLEFDERQEVRKAIKQFIRDRRDPELRLKRTSSKSKWWTIRAGRNVRVLLMIDGSMTIFYRAGPRDEINRFAKTTELVFPLEERPGLILLSEDVTDIDGLVIGADTTPGLLAGPADGKGLLNRWSDQDLRDAGFTDDQIEQIRQLADATDSNIHKWFGPDEARLLINLSEVKPEEWREQRLDGDTDREEHYRQSVESEGARVGFSSSLSDDELLALLRGPIEDWQVFLHPDQRELVKRLYQGASRVSGPAGTGKTVVALHRAAWLASRGPVGDGDDTDGASWGRGKKILFTTFSRSLAKSMKALYARLPYAVQGAVDFVNIDSLALGIAGKAYGNWNLDPARADAVLQAAYEQTVTSRSPLRRFSLDYLTDEIERLIKGRLLASKEAYFSAKRYGRVTRFPRELRELVWVLYENYRRALEKEKIVTFADINRIAIAAVEVDGHRHYDHVIVDEVQDFTLAQLQLARVLVSGHRKNSVPLDGLMLVGDDAQRLYSVGYKLGEANIDVRGRSVRLKDNYRNAQEIIDTSMACTGDRAVEDIDGEVYRVSSADYVSTRTGMAPILVEARDLDHQAEYIASTVVQLHDDGAADWHEIVVLGPFMDSLRAVASVLSKRDIQSHQLSRDTVPSKGMVTIATIDRAKGLEFKVVFVVGMSRVGFPTFPFRRDGVTDEQYADQLERDKSVLHVAMTRPRDRLYVLYNRQPSELLEPGLHLFERVKA